MRLPLALAALFAAACVVETPARDTCTPSPGGALTHWQDTKGRAVIWRGVNVDDAAKRTADLLPPVDADDYLRIAGWGLTAVRLLTFWQAIEPTPGAYDQAYLAALRRHVELAAAAGLAVVLDVHQDVFGEGFGHTGFPAWACDEELYATFTPPTQWFLGYFEPEVIECFDRFWESDALQLAYADALAELLAALGDHPAVVGLELINEPFWGGYPSAQFELDRLQPFYRRVAEALAAEQPRVRRGELRLVAEPSLTYNLGLGTALAPPFGCPTWAFAPHYYPLHSESGTYGGELEAVRSALGEMQRAAVQVGAPLVITELGTVPGPGSVAYLRDALAVADELMASLFIWDYGPGGAFGLVGADGTARAEAQAVQRAYAHRVAGEPTNQLWDESAGVLALTWRESRAVGETELVVPAALFPGGVSVSSSDPDGTWSHELVNGRLLIRADRSQSAHTVIVRRR